MRTTSGITRRNFFKLVGGGIVIGFGLGSNVVLAQRDWRRIYPEDFNAYLRIGEDGTVTVYSGKIEMGHFGLS